MKGTLMVSISGIRGIIGAGLDPLVIGRYAAAYGTWVRRNAPERPLVVIGRDARTTGEMCSAVVGAALQSTGCDVIDAGLAATPTVEMAVLIEEAAGGIILSASHNPAEWNALKLLGKQGRFLYPEEGREVIDIAEAGDFDFVPYDRIGTLSTDDYLDRHIDRILDLEFIRPEIIRRRDFRVLVDGVNSVGGFALPALLERLGVRPEQIIRINAEPTGRFAHPAEPLPENLTDTLRQVRESGADLGLVVDPDADRLALIEKGGVYVSEELTQVIAADFLWRIRSGPFVTNLSSSRAIEEVAARYGATVHRSAVGEINVVRTMMEVEAVLGGEGNGGVILPDLHYGRDALVGAAMVLQLLANERATLSEIRESLPRYVITKNKIPLDGADPDEALARLADRYAGERIDTRDGLKIDFDDGWAHLRKSNTEPILRIYTEARTEPEAAALAERFMAEIKGSSA